MAMRRLAVGLTVLAVATVAATARATPVLPPWLHGLPLPSGLRLVRVIPGTRYTADLWEVLYATNAPIRDLSAYADLLHRRHIKAIDQGPDLDFNFRTWEIIVCTDRSCGNLPRDRFAIWVSTPGG